MKNIIVPILLIVVFSAVGFYGGLKYQQSKSPSFNRDFPGQGGRMGQGQFSGNRQGARSINGEIINSDQDSITVKLPDGSSKIVLLSEKTVINKASLALKSDLKTGEKVAVFGTENTDGSTLAQNIQLNPLQRERINPISPTP